MTPLLFPDWKSCHLPRLASTHILAFRPQPSTPGISMNAGLPSSLWSRVHRRTSVDRIPSTSHPQAFAPHFKRLWQLVGWVCIQVSVRMCRLRDAIPDCFGHYGIGVRARCRVLTQKWLSPMTGIERASLLYPYEIAA